MGSPFASFVTKTVELPFDAPNTVTIRKLAGRHLQKARQMAQVDSSQMLVQMGGAKFLGELNEVNKAQKKEQPESDAPKSAEEAVVDPLATHDRFTVLCRGIKAWTYDKPVNEESIDDLDDQAADFLAREILKLTLPGGEDSQKKD